MPRGLAAGTAALGPDPKGDLVDTSVRGQASCKLPGFIRAGEGSWGVLDLVYSGERVTEFGLLIATS